MSDSAKDVVEKCEFWIRVNLALEVCVKEALIHILHNTQNDPSYKGLPTDPAKLHTYMSNCIRSKNDYNKKLFKDQLDMLCPASGSSDPREWDITVIVFVIRNETTLKPSNGWSTKDKPPPTTDITKGGCIDHAKRLRNDLNHGSAIAINTQPQFDKYWDRIKRILNGLNYKNMDKFNKLKTASLDKYNGEILRLVTNFDKDLYVLKNEASDNTNEIQKMKAKIDEVKEINQKVESNHKENQEKNNKLQKGMEKNTEEIKKLKPKIRGPLHWDLRQPVVNFHGRNDVIKNIEEKLNQSSTVAISAMGGCGKTQTAAKFVQIYKDEYENIFWIAASNLQISLARITRRLLDSKEDQENLSVLELVQKINQLTHATKVLYIIDNVFEDDLKNFETLMRNCASKNTKIIITTQLSQIPNDKVTFIHLPDFTAVESKTFLQENLNEASDQEIENLSSELGHFPLCLQQAVSYIKRHNTDISIFISNFQKCRKSILDPKKNLSDYDKTLLTVWDFAFEKLKESEKALKLFGMLCLMDNSCIKKQTFLYAKNIVEDDIELNEIVDTLCEYSLIQHDKDRLYIHFLTQKVVGNKMTELDENPKITLKKLLERIAEEFDGDELHFDEDDLWYIHYNKLILNQIAEDCFITNFNVELILKVSSNRFDVETYLLHIQVFLESANNRYKNNKSFEEFLNILLFKGVLITLNSKSNINPNEMKLFEDEFKEELKQSHPKINHWKIQKTYFLCKSRDVPLNESTKDIVSIYRYFDDEETEFAAKFHLIYLALYLNDVDRAEKMLEKIKLFELTLGDQYKWYSSMLRLCMRKRQFDLAKNILIDFENIFNKHNVPERSAQRDWCKIYKAKYLKSVGKVLEALDTIENCISANIKKRSDFVLTKFSILMKLQRFEEAREILPSNEEECKKDTDLYVGLAYYKFITNRFDEIEELFGNKFDAILYLIKIYSMAKKQFEERREMLSNEKIMEILDNLRLLHTWIWLNFDSII